MNNSIFINISNHPSNLWGDVQTKAALALGGDIVDVPFPPVPPMATSADVARLAADVVVSVHAVAAGRTVVAHVMGEMTLVFAIVSLLKTEGVVCVASTTERIAEVQPDGSKTSTFRFGHFREY